MEVKPGYKLTEAGVIPEDWKMKLLGELATVSAGGTPTRANAKYWNGDIPWITTSEVDFCTINDADQFITKDGLNNSAAKLLPFGTLLMALYGQGKTRGKVAVLGIEAATNQACAAISLKSGISQEFIFYFLASKYDVIRKLSNTGNQENLNSSLVRSISILFPPLLEQRAIATALSDIDALIAKLDQLITKKRDLKQATMQQLLTGRTRLPGFSGEWEVKQLGECLIGRPDYGINAPAVPYSDRWPAYIRITDISEDGRFSPESPVSVSHSDASRFYLNDGDLVFARTGASVGKAYLYNRSDGDLVFAGFLIRVHPDPSKLIASFLFNFVQSKVYWDWVRMMSMRSGQPGINGNEFAQLPLYLPSIDEQTAIAAILSDLDAELSALEARRDKTRALKQAMMQELLTGRIRLV